MIKHVSRLVSGLAAAIGMLLAHAGDARADELKVYSMIGVQAALEELAPKFEQASGHKLAFTWGTAAMMVKRVRAGETADVLVLTRPATDALAKDGKVVPGSAATIASSGIGVAVRKGAPKPDISTRAALEQALLAAKAISYSNPAAGGASGVYFGKLLERMGIADRMKAKTKFPPAGGNAAHLLQTGEVDLAIQQKPELMSATGVEVVGLLPGDLNLTTVYAAGIGTGAKDAATAQGFVKFLRTPAAVAVFRGHGLDPP
jgi:molybdate transport system substrate-binding protein